MLPKVSAYCPTYARPYLLEEAIESFLQQDYQGEKELIILNDYDGHTLHYDHPEIKIFNVSKHIKPIGKKYNETAKLCTGDILVTWDDDDISLPHRISLSVNKLLKSNKNIFHTRKSFVEETDFTIRTAFDKYKDYAMFHATKAVKREFFFKSNGYVELDDVAFDQLTMENFFKYDNYSSEDINLSEFFYIYRFDVTNNYHLTNFAGWHHVQCRMSEGAEFYTNQNKNNIPQGKYYLTPHWKRDYIKNTKLYLQKNDGL